jgi:hypothetical protein
VSKKHTKVEVGDLVAVRTSNMTRGWTLGMVLRKAPRYGSIKEQKREPNCWKFFNCLVLLDDGTLYPCNWATEVLVKVPR